jgi:Domain of unknown function (DUF4397)
VTPLQYSVLATAVFLAACSGTATSPGDDLSNTGGGTYATCNASQPSDLFPPPSDPTQRVTLWFINAAPRYTKANLCLDLWQGWTAQGLPYNWGAKGLFMRSSSVPHTLVVTAPGDSTVLASTQVTLAVDAQYTAVFTQRSTHGGLIVLVDTGAAPAATQALFRLMNAAPDAGAVDVYMPTGSADLTSLTPVVSNLAYEAVSPYLSYTPGPTRFIITAAGHPDTVIYEIGTEGGVEGQVWTGIMMNDPAAPTPTTIEWRRDRRDRN